MFKLIHSSKSVINIFIFITLFLFISTLFLDASSQADVNDLIKQGKGFYENGDYDRATLKFLEALNQAPTKQQEADIHFNLALSYFASAQSEKMKGHLEKLFALQPDRQIDMVMYPPDFVENFIFVKRSLATKLRANVAKTTISTNGEKKKGQTPAKAWTDPTTGMEFIWIQAGKFIMGANSEDVLMKPAHEVELDGFWMAKYEVTQGQWEGIMGNNPSFFRNGSNYPVDGIRWNWAQDFIKKLNERTGSNFRLPTEAEWEYACLARTDANWNENLEDIAWYSENSANQTHPVGKKRANKYGLYDMIGNVWEWCQDWYGSYSSGYEKNPLGPQAGDMHVFRGGSFMDSVASPKLRLSSAYLLLFGIEYEIKNSVKYNFQNFGFRLVKSK